VEHCCRLFLIRHGEAAMPDERGRILNYSDAPLTPRGRAQARRMAEVLEGIEVDAVVSSDLERARETARIVAGGRAPVLSDRRLREVDLGDYDGMTFAGVAEVDPRFVSWPGVAFYGRLARAGYHVPADLAFPAGESARTMTARLVPGLVDLATEWAGRTVAVVSHGWAIQGLLCHITAIDVAGYFRFTYANASTTLVEVDGAGRGALLVHNGNLELERATAGRLGVPEGPGDAVTSDRESTCRVVLLCAGGPADAELAGELRGLPVAAVRSAPGAASLELAAAVAAATGARPEVDARLAGAESAPAGLAELAGTALGSAGVLVVDDAVASHLAVHVLAGTSGGERLPALAGGLSLAEVERDGHGVLHIWNGRIAPEHVFPG
jgi:broad specificity phosphatase PhoE